MRIAVVASPVTPLRPGLAGGVQAFVGDLARGLTARGHEVTLHCAEGSEVEGVRLVMVRTGPGVSRGLVMPGGVTSVRVPALSAALGALFDSVAAAGPDVVSVHAFDIEAFEMAEAMPSVHTLHLPPLVPGVVAAVRASRRPMVTVSASARRQWLAAGVHSRLVRNGVPDFDPGPAEVAPVALIPGRISPEKGVPAAIRVARAAGLRPLVVGTVYDTAHFEQAVRPLLAQGEMRDAVSRPELWRLMAASAACVLPVEWEEPFGLVAAEAQMAGCPVVGYRRGALPEVVEEGVSGVLVAPGAEADLVAGVRTVLAWDRSIVRASGRRRLLLGPVIEAYGTLLTAVAGAA